ncbi:carboxymuconolactone decarboxylase [Mycobacterium sp. 852002-53434_SCH5985345]|uniref:carboxymuconolactone decarboxylase family protein n=1 Tax=Mycobacterium sp. 852002-53434_SCH5985345 TaxID=1834107 RepID=UPI000801EEB0|nr:carboxymuconolactone decarboxylase family protein [Mycobacterium sp. 852002-53434_SCH5985345]OBF49119.1 carboxymuconolactone decarboxylase [Mycobacterium sp. 852002-53434_SCH5985345]
MTDSRPVRLTPLPAEDWDERARASLASLIPPERANPSGAGNVLSTLVRHPDLTRAYLPFNAYLLRGSTLSPRVREVALLRVVSRGECEYLWDHHIPIAERAGLSAQDISAIRSGVATDGVDRMVVGAVDELMEHHTITQPTWDELGSAFSDQQRMDLVFTIGGYLLLALAVNTLGVQSEHS